MCQFWQDSSVTLQQVSPATHAWNRLRLWSQHPNPHSSLSAVLTRQVKNHLFSSFNALPPTPSHAITSKLFPALVLHPVIPPPQAELQAKACNHFHHITQGKGGAQHLLSTLPPPSSWPPPPTLASMTTQAWRASALHISKRHTGQDRPAVSLPLTKSHKGCAPPSTPISGVVVCARPYSFGCDC